MSYWDSLTSSILAWLNGIIEIEISAVMAIVYQIRFLTVKSIILMQDAFISPDSESPADGS